MLTDGGNEGIGGWRFGGFVLDPLRRRLLHNGSPVHVDERPFDLLVLLASHHDRPLERREITTALWGARPVGDNTLRQLVYKARRAVGDDGERQSVIRTLHGRSMQWVAPLEAVETPAAGPRAAPPGATARHARARWWQAAVIALAILCIAIVSVRRADAPSHNKPLRLVVAPISNQTGEKSLDWIAQGLPGLLVGLLGQAGGIDLVDPLAAAREWRYRPQQGRTQEQQLRYATGATALIGGDLHKLAEGLYRLDLHLVVGDKAPVQITLTGGKPGALAADALPRIRHALRLDKPAVPSRLPHDAFLAEAYARGMDLVAHGKWNEAIEYFRLCARSAPDFLPAAYAFGVARYETDDVPGGEQTLQMVARQAKRQGDTHMLASALLQLGHLARTFDKNAQALQYLRQAAAATGDDNARTSIEVHALLADVLHKLQQPAASQSELRKARVIAAQHPDLVVARALLYDMEGSIAFDAGDLAGSVAADREALALRESLGDEHGVIVGMFNLANALRAMHRNADSLTLSADSYQRALAAGSLNMRFADGANLAASLVSLGLSRPAVAAAMRLTPLAEQLHSAEYQVLALQLRAMGEMQLGDFHAALVDLRKGDALVDVSKLEYATFLQQETYEAMASFEAEPPATVALSKAFDALADGHMHEDGYARRRAVLHALAAAAARRPVAARNYLREAAALPALPGDSDFELRMPSLLVALAGNDLEAAEIALKGYDPATTPDAGVLPLYVRWATQRGDKVNAARGRARLAVLRKQGIDALVATGLGPADPLAVPAPARAPAAMGGGI
ncbi:MAG TPA: winged helix-turn-helix domain-containing protein [Rhodanobacteraceae bacterium]|nr:winged helix-turn-helix domain-containing protein [Rhodanobacteraceae bacterium]